MTKQIRNLTLGAFSLLAVFVAPVAQAASYVIDTAEKHAFIQFKVSHLGFSYVVGEFPDFEGSFVYDIDDPSVASVTVTIDTTTVDTRHAKRNLHIRSKDFLDVKEFPTAKFVSTSYEATGGGDGVMTGDLTLHGVTRPVSVNVSRIGAGEDPWGNYRIGFEGTTTITLSDFGMNYNLGPASRVGEIYFSIEGIRE